MTHYTLDDYLIVEAECCRKWPVPLGIPGNRCGECNQHPVVTTPMKIIRAPEGWDEDDALRAHR